jgi:cyclohexyl-isocyanide hydratase
MPHPTRRDLGTGLAALALALAGGTPPAAGAEAPPPAHDMTEMPAAWMGREQIAMLVYPGFTALDLVGPHYMLTSLMGATTHVVARSRDPVVSDTGLTLVPSATFAEVPADLDILFVPGGTSGTLAAMRDPATMDFLAGRGRSARFVTSVCTGSLLLGAAGLLDGYEATSHWMTRSLLPIFGAKPVERRVVRDRNRITGAGVTAGVDFGLAMVADLRDRLYAESVQLLAEYAPEPPFRSGSPDTAPSLARKLLEDMLAGFLQRAEETGRAAFAARRPG